MKNIQFILLFFATLFSISCATKEIEIPGNKAAEARKILTYQDSIANIVNRTNSWKELDKFYRTEIAYLENEDLTNKTIFWLFNPMLNFIEGADSKTIEYYLGEAEKIEFNTNLWQIIKMLEKVETQWDSDRTAKYASEIYQKNFTYWSTNFPGKTSYLEKNDDALAALKVFSTIK